MGQREPGGRGGGQGERGELSMRVTTVAELEDWEQSGAVWQPVEITPERAVVDLCTCFGEPMDRVQSEDPLVIEFVRTHQLG